MHLIKVDLPDPEGPHITNTSPSATSIDIPFRAWKSPNHFLTSTVLIMLICLYYLSPKPKRFSNFIDLLENTKVNTQKKKDKKTNCYKFLPINTTGCD
jgi:hypothetical protein